MQALAESPLPPLAALKAFHAAARSERFSLAAEELHVSQSAVSHHIRHLEEYLGVRLFDRTGTSVRLTEAGVQYFAEVHPALERIREATMHLRAYGQRRRVTLAASPSAVNIWLIPNWASFEARCPDIDLQLLAGTRLVDLDRERVDLALRFGHQTWSGVATRWLFPEQLIPVCTPEYLPAKVFGDPAAVLAQSRLIVNDTDPDEWESWCEIERLERPNLDGALRFAEAQQVLRAAENGLGLAIGRRPVVDTYLLTGSLVAPLGATELEGQGCYLCHSERSPLPPHVTAVAEWLEDLASQIVPVDELVKSREWQKAPAPGDLA